MDKLNLLEGNDRKNVKHSTIKNATTIKNHTQLKEKNRNTLLIDMKNLSVIGDCAEMLMSLS